MTEAGEGGKARKSSSRLHTRRGFLSDAAKFAAGAGLGALSKDKETSKQGPQAIIASECKRKGTPVVARFELLPAEGMGQGLRELLDRGGALTVMVDAPTDAVTLYAEKLRLTGKPIPDDVQEQLTSAVNGYVREVDRILGELS